MACNIVLESPTESLGAVDMLLHTAQVLSKNKCSRFLSSFTFPWDKCENSKKGTKAPQGMQNRQAAQPTREAFVELQWLLQGNQLCIWNELV